MPSQKKYPVTLAAEDREALERVTRTGVHPASVIRRARLLLALDTAVGAVEDRVVIAEQVGVSCRRCGWSPGGSPRPVAMCGPRWSGRTRVPAGALAGDRRGRGQADRAGVLGPAGRARAVVAAAAGEACRADRGHPGHGSLHDRTGVKKTELRPHLKKCWTIPPRANAEFAARWRMCSRFTTAPMTRRVRWCAWMRSRTSCSATSVSRSRPGPDVTTGRTASTSVTAPARSSAGSGHCGDGAVSRPGRSAPRSTGHIRSGTC